MEDRPAGAQLMTQGEEIDLVYLIVDGLVVVEEERRVAVQKQKSLGPTGSSSGMASAMSGLVSSSSPSLLSYVFGSAGDDQVHGFMADQSAVTATDKAAHPTGMPQHTASANAGAAVELPPSSSPSSLVPPAAPSESGLVHAVREAAQRGVHVLDQLTGLHQPAQHVASLHEPTDAEQQHQYQQTHSHHKQPTSQLEHGHDTTQLPHSLSASSTESATAESTAAAAATHSGPPSAQLAPSSASSSLPALLVASGASLVPSSSAGESVDAQPQSSPAEQERDRKRQDRRAKREKRRREKQSQSGIAGQLGSSGLPSTLVSVSADGSYEIRRETLGYMRSGRLVGEMSLLTTTAPTNAAKTQTTADTARDASANGHASDSAAPSNGSSNRASAPSSSLLSSLPSPSELLAPASSSPIVATASVTCVEACRVLVWRREALRSLFFRFPSLSVGWYATVSSAHVPPHRSAQ